MAVVPRNVSMEELGPGVELVFRNRDILVLQNKFGPNWFNHLIRVLGDESDFEACDTCLQVGGKKGGKEHKITFDDCDVLGSGQEVLTRVLDAICLSMTGKSYVDMIKDIAAKLANVKPGEGDGAPPPNPGAFLANSAEQLSGQASDQQNSGT